jgi:tRNA1Val (adenine37-N6)-methyltransferase
LSIFRFQQFEVQQDRCAMKVGTDGILLGAWAPLGQAARILDIGTGTGLLALMAAQRCPQAQIDAVEVEPQAAEQARENVQRSPFGDRIRVLQGKVQDLPGAACYDHIICNPPYYQQGLAPPAEGRRMARHAHSLSYPELIKNIGRLLAPDGKSSLILPVHSFSSFLSLAAEQNLFPSSILSLRSHPHKAVKRCLFTLDHKPKTAFQKEMSVHQGQSYSKAFRALTKDFYLGLE